MALTADSWPIAASTLPFSASSGVNEAFAAVKRAGFDDVDLTDTWMPFGDFDTTERGALRDALEAAGLRAQSLSVIRRSVTDGDANLAYSHRAIDLAVELGIGVVSVGLHRPLTALQREQLWFWTVAGHRDPLDDPDD